VGVGAGRRGDARQCVGFPAAGAIGRDPELGGFGIAAGVLAGFALHAAGERLGALTAALDDVVVRLSVHAVTAGVVIGAVYASLPGIGLLLGLSIVSHKGPAGYAAARRLGRSGRSVVPLVVPAAGVGIPALAVSLLGWRTPEPLNAVVFGVAAGVFLHLAVDFLASGTSGETEAPADRTGLHRAVGAIAGIGCVVLAWVLVTGL
jgi:ZIP family zinc transporter